MINPKISIVIPIYMVEPYITKCIESIINQTYCNYEIILVDDGSTDNSLQIAESLLENAGKVYISRTQKNQGQYSARNVGEKCATGDWILYVDSDDTIAINTLQKMVDVINKEDVEVVIPDFQMIQIGDEFRAPAYDLGVEYLTKKEIQNKFLFREIKILAPATLYNLKWYRANNLTFKKILYGEDVHFLWEMLKYVNRVAYIKSPLYNYVMRPGSTMTSSKYYKIVQAHHDYLKLHKSYQELEDASLLVKKYLYPRYVLGILHSAYPLCTKEEYKSLCNELDATQNMKTLLAFPRIKEKILASIYLLSPHIFRIVMKISYKRNENIYIGSQAAGTTVMKEKPQSVIGGGHNALIFSIMQSYNSKRAA